MTCESREGGEAGWCAFQSQDPWFPGEEVTRDLTDKRETLQRSEQRRGRTGMLLPARGRQSQVLVVGQSLPRQQLSRAEGTRWRDSRALRDPGKGSNLAISRASTWCGD